MDLPKLSSSCRCCLRSTVSLRQGFLFCFLVLSFFTLVFFLYCHLLFHFWCLLKNTGLFGVPGLRGGTQDLRPSCGMRDLSLHHVGLVPWPGIEPGTPALWVRNLGRWATREALQYILTINYNGGLPCLVQWLRIHLPMQGTRVPSLVQKDSVCDRVTRPVILYSGAGSAEPTRHNCWRLSALEPLLHKRSHHSQKPMRGYYTEEAPLTARRESLSAATETQHSQK